MNGEFAPFYYPFVQTIRAQTFRFAPFTYYMDRLFYDGYNPLVGYYSCWFPNVHHIDIRSYW